MPIISAVLDDSILQTMSSYTIIELTLDKDFESIIGEASDVDGDDLSIIGLKVQGENAVLKNGYTVQINDKNQIILKGKTKSVIGYTILKFWVSDGMSETIVKNTYTPRYAIVKTINHPPKVKVSKPKIVLNKKNGLKYDLIVATFKDPDGDNSPYTVSAQLEEGEDVVRGTFKVEDNKVIMKANLTGTPGIQVVNFVLHDKFQIYSEAPEPAMFSIKSINVPPRAHINTKYYVHGLEAQTITLGSITDDDHDDTFEIEEFTVANKKLRDNLSLFTDGNDIKLKVSPSPYNCGMTKISFVLHDSRRKYTSSDAHKYITYIIFENKPPTLIQTCLSLVMPNGTTIKKEIGTIEDTDGDENFSVTVLERNKNDEDPPKSCNVVTGELTIKDNKLYIDATAAEGRVGTEVIKFVINDSRQEYTSGTQQKYKITIKVV